MSFVATFPRYSDIFFACFLMINKSRINGLVLAGGLSSRMGVDKRLINFHGIPQGEFIYNLLQKYCDQVFTSCNAHQQVKACLNPLRDTLTVKGPVNGILSAFEYDPHHAWLVIAVDMPNINDQVLDALVARRDPSLFATCFYNPTEKLPEPLCTIWEPAGLSSLYNSVKHGLTSPRLFLDNNRKHINLVFPEYIETLLNVNVRSELDEFTSTYGVRKTIGPDTETSPCRSCERCPTRENSLFQELTLPEVDQLEKVKSHLTFRYGELIYKEGQFPSGIYIVNQGKVKISKYGFEGREQIIQFSKTGDLLGHRSAFAQEKYTCSATAIAETHLCFIPQEFIVSVIKRNSELGFRIMKLLATELRQAEDKAVQIAQKTVRERVAEALLLLKDMYGFERDNATLNINLKREELAGLAGTVRETATRFLSELRDSEIISLSGKKIKILDLKRLVHSANPIKIPGNQNRV